MKNAMKNTRNQRMRKFPFSCSTDKTTNDTEPNPTSNLFRYFLDPMYTSLVARVTPELLILISIAIFLLIDEVFVLTLSQHTQRQTKMLRNVQC